MSVGELVSRTENGTDVQNKTRSSNEKPKWGGGIIQSTKQKHPLKNKIPEKQEEKENME